MFQSSVLCSLAQSLSYVLIGQFNLWIRRTRVSELISSVSVLKISPNSTQVCWDVKLTILLGNHLNDTKQILNDVQML